MNLIDKYLSEEEKIARWNKKMKQLFYFTSRNTSTTVNADNIKKAKAIIKNSKVKQKIVTEDIMIEGKNKPIKIYKNKEYGIESHVTAVWGKENMEGYGVRLKDTDANKFIEITKIFPNEKDAHDYAKHLVKKY